MQVFKRLSENISANIEGQLNNAPLSKPLPETERGFDSCSPSLQGKGLGVRFEIKLHTALNTKQIASTARDFQIKNIPKLRQKFSLFLLSLCSLRLSG
jgi:hypothetical protein